jgi:hypothetical protein
VTLKDGRSVSSSPVNNFYFVALPPDAKPWDVVGIRADLVGGGFYHRDIDIHAPPNANS